MCNIGDFVTGFHLGVGQTSKILNSLCGAFTFSLHLLALTIRPQKAMIENIFSTAKMARPSIE